MDKEGKALDAKGRCCGRKPLHYKRGHTTTLGRPQFFCVRCSASYDPETGAQLANRAYPNIATAPSKATQAPDMGTDFITKSEVEHLRAINADLLAALRKIVFLRKAGPTPAKVPGALIEEIERIALAAISRATASPSPSGE